ncbi:MAG TPA: tagaturonate reductase, partial [archaeon]|nr:tagaturonate reductase [archaeon]
MERFANPHIKHYLLSIALNSTSKYRARVLPSVVDFQKRTGVLPPHLCFGLAALIAFYRGKTFRDGVLIGEHHGEEYRIVDDNPVLDFFSDLWRAYTSPADLRALVTRVLANTSIWGQDLNALPGMTDAIATYLTAILDMGMVAALRRLD